MDNVIPIKHNCTSDCAEFGCQPSWTHADGTAPTAAEQEWRVMCAALVLIADTADTLRASTESAIEFSRSTGQSAARFDLIDAVGYLSRAQKCIGKARTAQAEAGMR